MPQQQQQAQISVEDGDVWVKGPRRVGYVSQSTPEGRDFDMLADLDFVVEQVMTAKQELSSQVTHSLATAASTTDTKIADAVGALRTELMANLTALQNRNAELAANLSTAQKQLQMQQVMALTVTVRSSGFCNGSAASATVNGVEQLTTSTRGMNLVAIDRNTHEVSFKIRKKQ